MKLELLPNDGGVWHCSYGFYLYEDWHCTESAVGLIGHDDLEAIVSSLSRHEALHGRAFCQLHADALAAKIANAS